MEKGSLKGAQMRAFYFLPQNIYVNHPAIFDKYKLRKEDKKVEQTHQKIRKTSERKSRHV